MFSALRLVVFDWDGTLMDSQARIVACLQTAIANVGSEPRTEAQLSNIIGLGLVEAVEALYPGHDAALVEALAEQYRVAFVSDDLPQSVMFEGALELLDSLLAQDYMLAVATGKSRRGLRREFERTGLGELFHNSRCADETRSKPHPQMLLELMSEMQVSPEEVVMIGDTEFDLEMAVKGGVRSVGLGHGVHSKERLLKHAPLLVVENLIELASHFEPS